MMMLYSFLCLIGVPFALSIANWIQVAPILIKKQLTWPEAQNYCRENHLDLYTFRDSSDQAKLYKALKKHNEIGPVWVGLYNDLDSWYWSYNHLPLKNTTLNNFASGQPDNKYPNAACAGIGNDGLWFNLPCSIAGPCVCYDANNSPQNKFVAYNVAFNFQAAKTFCQTQHTDLASTTTMDDVNLIKQVLSSSNLLNAYFGLTRDTWKWSDAAEPLFLPWGIGQPDNFYTWESCGMAQSGLLLDEACTNLHYFACSAYLHKIQFVKLHVMTSASILDPAVQSAILDSIGQKLEQIGMAANTTVTWKVQADGNIFHKTRLQEISMTFNTTANETVQTNGSSTNNGTDIKDCKELNFLYND